ncbi:MAG: baseplate multidomain protein megatron [Planktomarina sp.]
MATLVLSAAGMALGGSVGGTVMGLSMAAIGRAGGAMLGRAIDQRLLGGSASRSVETGRLDRFRIMGAAEGTPIANVYGRMRVGGSVIWATKFLEHANTTSETVGGKGGGGATVMTTEYSYTVSLAVAVCEGQINRIGRIWADGQEIATADLTMRVYPGSRTQLPDPKIEAVQGTGNAPAFRGTAYVVFEDLPLAQFGNRIPQFSFEVMRPSQGQGSDVPGDISQAVRAVALMPGSGEYSLASTPVHFDEGQGRTTMANQHTRSGAADMPTAIDALVEELPNCGSTSLIVSWFGDDLRCGSCSLTPRVEQTEADGNPMAWAVSSVTRADAQTVPQLDGRPAYGGTPTDQSVLESIATLRARGQAVMFYPFILMTQLDGNTLPDPWSGQAGQPAFPWRGRITTSIAPGQSGSADGTAQAEAEVAAFFGTAQPSDFTRGEDHVAYHGPDEFSYRRFILHYAHLCAISGGVESFCIGSEMRSLTWVRGAAGQFVAVQHLKQLAADVRSILGPDVKLTYAADWSEYFGYQPQDGSEDRYFHLDPLWADDNIDFVGIDNYMPLSDWRDTPDHLDAGWGSIYNLDYLMANVEGGEGFDWYYHSSEARAAQFRDPIEDGTASEPWAFRYKDIRGWWQNPHYNRVGGVRSLQTTEWVPQSKPIWFTELGCAAIDKATNHPNKFLDPKSSESTLPRYSNGQRDELIQMQYLRAMYGHWGNPDNNPMSTEYDGRMIDLTRAHVWAWDARPFPAFPDYLDVWSDGENYTKGHWITGRSNARPLDSLVAEICAASNVTDVDVSELYGYVRGYSVGDVTTARAALQPLMLAYGFDVAEREGKLIFKNRTGRGATALNTDRLVLGPDTDPPLMLSRDPEAEIADRVRLNYIRADGSFEAAAAETIFPADDTQDVAVTDLNLALTAVEAQQITERWLAEARVSRDKARFALPPSMTHLGAADVVSIAEPGGGQGTYRIDQVEVAGQRLIDAVRIEDGSYDLLDLIDETPPVKQSASPAVPAPVFAQFMDLPMMTGDETPHAPHWAVTADPWTGGAQLYRSGFEGNYAPFDTASVAATMGTTLTDLPRAAHGILDHGPALRVDLTQGTLASIPHEALLAGGNLAAIGDDSADHWELFQFETATPVASGVYDVTTRLRGQLGSDALMPDVWPAGSVFVLINGAVRQMDLPSAVRGVAQYFKVAPHGAGPNDASATAYVQSFAGNGLRPYAPVWLCAAWENGDLSATWIRRTRLNGDAWGDGDVPLSEATERYRVQIVQNGTVLHSADVNSAEWTYTAAMAAGDGVAAGQATLQVAQVSDVYGAGLYRSVEVVF